MPLDVWSVTPANGCCHPGRASHCLWPGTSPPCVCLELVGQVLRHWPVLRASQNLHDYVPVKLSLYSMSRGPDLVPGLWSNLCSRGSFVLFLKITGPLSFLPGVRFRSAEVNTNYSGKERILADQRWTCRVAARLTHSSVSTQTVGPRLALACTWKSTRPATGVCIFFIILIQKFKRQAQTL